MDPKILREKMRIISRCERDSFFASPSHSDATTRAVRLSSFVANIEGKRRQMIERLLERTLSSYLDDGKHDSSEDSQ